MACPPEGQDLCGVIALACLLAGLLIGNLTSQWPPEE